MRLRKQVIDGKPSTVLRRLWTDGPHPTITVFGGTPHHAQLAEASGFSHFGISGAHSSMQLLGLPDAGFLTLNDLAENTRRICQAVSIPVLVDCDTGFGNAVSVYRTVDEIIRAGAAGLILEDQVAPKRCGFSKGKEVISIEEAVGKYRAACDVRNKLDPDFVITARTDARGAAGGGMDEVLRRGRAYLETGVDVLHVEALQNREEIQIVRDTFPNAMLRLTPFAIDPPLSLAEMAAYRLCSASLHIPNFGAVAMYDFLQDFKRRSFDAWNEFGARTKDHPLGGFRFFDLTGFPKVFELEEKYLPAASMERYEKSIGVYDPRDAEKKK
jgi:2-methylisocitrate lyase-like PEP mutase family enzyme